MCFFFSLKQRVLDVLLCIGFMYGEKKRDNVRFWFHRDALKNDFLPSTSEFLNYNNRSFPSIFMYLFTGNFYFMRYNFPSRK